MSPEEFHMTPQERADWNALSKEEQDQMIQNVLDEEVKKGTIIELLPTPDGDRRFFIDTDGWKKQVRNN